MFQQKIETTDLCLGSGSGIWVWGLQDENARFLGVVNSERIKPHIKQLAKCERLDPQVKCEAEPHVPELRMLLPRPQTQMQTRSKPEPKPGQTQCRRFHPCAEYPVICEGRVLNPS